MEKDTTSQTLLLLMQLQDHLMAKSRLKHEIEQTPVRIRECREDTEKHKLAVAEAEEALKQEKLESSRLEGDLKQSQEALSDKQVQTNVVKTNEQLWALQKEIEFIKQKISKIELKIIESMEEIDRKTEELAQAREALKEHEADNERKISEMEKALSSMETELTAEEKALQNINADIPPKYSRLLKRIQEAKPDGLGMSEAIDGNCSLCNFRIRPQVYVEVKMAKKIHQCTNCSRILFYRSDADDNGDGKSS